jgi:hypothetical protein
MVIKICPWDGGVCRFASCDIILPNGDVTVCKFHGDKLGRSTPRKVGVVLPSVFSKHVLRRR